MQIDDSGEVSGNVWTFGNRLMLFADDASAERLMEGLGKQSPDTKYARRGVTEPHLKQVIELAEGAEVPIFVVVGITAKGTIEAIPFEEHQNALKAGPPPTPPPGA